jgi:hypothetical protein
MNGVASKRVCAFSEKRKEKKWKMIMALSVNSTKQAFASLKNTAGKSMRIQYVRKQVNALKKNA